MAQPQIRALRKNPNQQEKSSQGQDTQPNQSSSTTTEGVEKQPASEQETPKQQENEAKESKQEENPRFFQATGVIEGEVSFDEQGFAKARLMSRGLVGQYQFVIPDALYEEELIALVNYPKQELPKLGLRVEGLDPAQVQQAFAYQTRFPALTVQDCFALTLAKTTEQSLLLTGDNNLRAVTPSGQSTLGVALASRGSRFINLLPFISAPLPINRNPLFLPINFSASNLSNFPPPSAIFPE